LQNEDSATNHSEDFRYEESDEFDAEYKEYDDYEEYDDDEENASLFAMSWRSVPV